MNKKTVKKPCKQNKLDFWDVVNSPEGPAFLEGAKEFMEAQFKALPEGLRGMIERNHKKDSKE